MVLRQSCLVYVVDCLFVFCLLFLAFINLSHVSPEGLGVVGKAIFYNVLCTKLQGIFHPITL